MILDPNGSSFDNDRAHAFWHSDTGQSVLKVIKAATKDSGSGGGSDCGCDCYEVEENPTVILSEQTLTLSSNGRNQYGDQHPKIVYEPASALIGQSVVVTFNGKEYACIVNKNKYGDLELGGGYNWDAYTPDFSEYPFSISIDKDNLSTNLLTNATGEATVKIEIRNVTPSGNFKLAVEKCPGTQYKILPVQGLKGLPVRVALYTDDNVIVDNEGNIVYVVDSSKYVEIPKTPLFLVSNDSANVRLGYIENGTGKSVNIPLSGSYLKVSDYDYRWEVKNAGGIASYVGDKIGGALKDIKLPCIVNTVTETVYLSGFHLASNDEIYEIFNIEDTGATSNCYVQDLNITVQFDEKYQTENSGPAPLFNEFVTQIRAVPYDRFQEYLLHKAGIHGYIGVAVLNNRPEKGTSGYIYSLRLYMFGQPDLSFFDAEDNLDDGIDLRFQFINPFSVGFDG